MPRRYVDFAKTEAASTLTDLFMSDDWKGMLEEKDYLYVDLGFPFVSAFTDRCLGRNESHEQTTAHTKYTDLMKSVRFPENDGSGGPVTGALVDDLATEIKKLVVKTFVDHTEKGLFTLKFHLLDHLAEDITRFGSLPSLDATAFEHLNITIRKSYRTNYLSPECFQGRGDSA